MRPIILASNSPRRKEIMKMLFGNNFQIIPSSYEEDNTINKDPKELAMLHSEQKAIDVAGKSSKGIVIAADTIVIHDNKIIGKPIDNDDARNMLNMLQGKEVDVISGITIIDIENNKKLTCSETTAIIMKPMTKEDIESYIRTGEPMGKSGALGAQEKGSLFVEKIDGCFFNVVGLPVARMHDMLKELGIDILEY